MWKLNPVLSDPLHTAAAIMMRRYNSLDKAVLGDQRMMISFLSSSFLLYMRQGDAIATSKRQILVILVTLQRKLFKDALPVAASAPGI